MYAFRLHPGDDLLLSLQEITRAVPLGAGYVVTCVGSLKQAALRLSNRKETTILRRTMLSSSAHCERAGVPVL